MEEPTRELETVTDVTSIGSSAIDRDLFHDAFLTGELASILQTVQESHEALLRANEEGLSKLFPQMLCRYEATIIRLRQCLGTIHFHGRDHLIREIRRCHDFYRSSKFQLICEAWIGTPGVEETVSSIRRDWAIVDQLISPSSEEALRQLVRYAVPSYQQDSRMGSKESFPKVVNFNVANAGAGAQANQKTSQELQTELKLAQTLEIANSQETRFKALLKDLNSTAADLVTNIDQAQNAQQEIIDASNRSEQVINEMKAQNACAQTIANEIKRDRGLSRSLLTACAALAVCLGLPKLAFLLPLVKKIPAMKSPVCAIEKKLHHSRNSVVLANLVRERHSYKISYETLQEVASIERHGNLFHKFAFGFLGLGQFIDRRMEVLPPPSDALSEEERWIDQRASSSSPPQWSRSAL